MSIFLLTILLTILLTQAASGADNLPQLTAANWTPSSLLLRFALFKKSLSHPAVSGGFSGRPESITVPSVEPVSIQGIINRVPSQSAPSSETTGTASRRRVRPRVELTGTRSRPRGRAPETEQEGDTESPPTGSRSRVRSRFTGSTPKTTATGNRLRFKKIARVSLI